MNKFEILLNEGDVVTNDGDTLTIKRKPRPYVSDVGVHFPHAGEQPVSKEVARFRKEWERLRPLVEDYAAEFCWVYYPVQKTNMIQSLIKNGPSNGTTLTILRHAICLAINELNCEIVDEGDA